MFSGIVEALSKIDRVEKEEASLRIWVACPASFGDLKSGDSVAVNGVCLTLEQTNQGTMAFSLGVETLSLLGHPEAGQMVNLERSLRLGDRVHGHFVTGHVDTLGEVLSSRAEQNSWLLTVAVPAQFRRFLWPKGSVALNGVSLTLNRVEHLEEQTHFEVCLIPETISRTNLAELRQGDRVNVELDSLARAFVNSWGEKHVPV